MKLPQQALQIFHSARRHGFNDGLVIPILRAGRSRFGLVRLAGCSPDIDAESRTTLSLMGICFFHHVRALVPHSGFAKPPANLTAREIECIRLVARGFSDRRLGTTLSISQSTAHEHVESAKRKLRVSTRAELIGVAASLAIIAS